MIAPEVLNGCPALAGLSAATRADLAAVARKVEYVPDERLVPLIRPPQQLLFILGGLAKLVGVSVKGVERIVYVFRPGDIVGSRILLEESAEAAYEIVAMRPVKALAITRHDFLRVVEDHPDLLMAVTREFSRRLTALTGRMLAAMSEDVPVRLGQLLVDFAAEKGDELVPLSYPLTHEAMAQIIGASRPHTSTVLRDLEEMGLVRRRSERGLLVHPGGLKRMVRDSGEDFRRAV